MLPLRSTFLSVRLPTATRGAYSQAGCYAWYRGMRYTATACFAKACMSYTIIVLQWCWQPSDTFSKLLMMS